MAQVGSVTCDFVKGSLGGLREQVETWRIPGRDGFGAIKMGQGGSAFVFTCVEYDTEGNINTWRTNMEALQATVVSIVDDRGRTHSNCLVTSVGVPRITRADGPSYNYRGEIVVKGVQVS